MARLRSTAEWELPLTEVSALALRERGAGARELVAVSDEDFTVASAELDQDHEVVEAATHPLAPLLSDELVSASEGSEFEGVACDGDGRVFILQEGPARILVVSPDWSELAGIIDLHVERDEPGLGRPWHDEDSRNARGEALLLLRKSHLLVVKQRDPVCFIEFGPVGSSPAGLGPEAYLRRDEAFGLGDAGRTDYVVLSSWPLHSERFPGLNEVGLGDDGRLYVISSASRRIGRVERRVSPSEDAVRIGDDWELPDGLPAGEEGKPEGLTLLPALTPIVSIDTREPGANLVRLEPLSA
jgi:hypothetical protein